MDEYVFGIALGLAMAGTNLFKRYLPAAAVPLCSYALTLALAVAWAPVFGVDYLDALQEAAVAGAVALGLFAGSDAAVRKATTGYVRKPEE